MKEIYLNSTLLHSLTGAPTFVVKTPIEGLEYPEMRMSKYSRAGEYGAIVPNALYDGRHITLQGYVLANTVTAYEAARRTLEAALTISKDENNKIQPHTLKFTTMDDLALQCEVYVKGFQMRRDNIIGGEFFLDLYAPDYPLYSQELVTITHPAYVGGGFVLPVVLPIISAPSSGGYVTVTNNGNAETYPVITISGTGSTVFVYLLNVTLNRIVWTGIFTINSGDQVVVDMKNKTMKLNSQSIIQYKIHDSKFWWLEPGANTLFGRGGTIQYSYRHAYIGA